VKKTQYVNQDVEDMKQWKRKQWDEVIEEHNTPLIRQALYVMASMGYTPESAIFTAPEK
jgi:hypothetical protein